MHQSDVKKVQISVPLYQQKMVSMELSDTMPPAAVLGLLIKDLRQQNKFKHLAGVAPAGEQERNL
eukprot:8803389-Karenia_brevis.AAC.1